MLYVPTHHHPVLQITSRPLPLSCHTFAAVVKLPSARDRIVYDIMPLVYNVHCNVWADVWPD